MSRKRFPDHFIPHERNGFRPSILGGTALAIVFFLAVFVEAAYVIQKDVVASRIDFLAAVLPGSLIELTNDDRTKNGVGELTEDPLLTAAAQLKADDMAAKGYFAHVTPDGKQPWDFLSMVGYRYSHAGENLAVNFTDSEDVEEAWMDSPTHRANIVKSVYTKVGIAVARGTYKGESATFVVQMFATPAEVVAVAPEPSAPLTASTPVEDETILSEETAPAAPQPQTQPAPAVTEAPEVAIAPIHEAPSVLGSVAASPNEAATLVLVGLGALLLVMLGIAIHAHMRLPYVEALGGTTAVLALVGALLLFNAGTSPAVEVPTDGLSASVVNALQ